MRFGVCAPVSDAAFIASVGFDYLEVNAANISAMTDEEFEAFVKYHLATCEKRELLGSSSHLVYVCRKID